jgi:hypothetical protein
MWAIQLIAVIETSPSQYLDAIFTVPKKNQTNGLSSFFYAFSRLFALVVYILLLFWI